MIRSIIWYLNFIFSLIFTLPSLLLLKRNKKNMSEKDSVKKANEIARKWCSPKIKIAGARVHISGLENIPKDQGVLFVSNHQSNFDIAIMITEINVDKGYMAKIEMKKVPILRTWMELINCVFLDRNNVKSQGKALLDAIKLLKGGYSMLVFPEGTRSKGSFLNEFQQTSLKMATKAKVPIIPITIDGTYKIMEEHNNKITPADVYLTIHEPIETKDIKNDEITQLNKDVMAIIESALHYKTEKNLE